jgi:hypothetical protein
MWLAEASAAAVVPAAVVVTVNADCTLWLFVIVTIPGLKLHFGRLTSPLLVPVTEHVRFTAPVKPPLAPTETGVIDVVPAGRTAEAGVLVPNVNNRLCPAPFPQPAVQATTTAADAADAVKFASPL